VLEVVVTDNIITQKLTTAEDKFYTRVRDNEIWTNWNEWSSEGTSSEGGQSVDLSNYYTKSETYSKNEVDELIENIDVSSGESVDLSDYYTKNEVDKLDNNTIPNIYNNRFLLGASNERMPIKLSALNKLRPNTNYRAFGIYIDNVANLVFHEINSVLSPIYIPSGSSYVIRVQYSDADCYHYKQVNGKWELQDTPKKAMYDLTLTSSINKDDIFIAETGLQGTIGNILGNKYSYDKVLYAISQISQDGRYRVYNGDATFPEPIGIVDAVVGFDFKHFTFHSPTKTYVKCDTISGTSSTSNPWREICNTSYNINSYYTKREVDNALTSYPTTEQTVELINSLIGVPKTSLIEQTNRIIEMLKGEK
jgi:hypothetical protein